MGYGLLSVFMFLLFFLSNAGYWSVGYNRLKLNKFYLPSALVCTQMFAMYIAGILNLLPYCAAIFCVMGIILLLQQIINKEFFKLLDADMMIVVAFLLLGVGVIAFYVGNRRFIYYDDFTHWALVVKNILLTNRFPDFTDKVIQFQEYPLGSASYIYYFCKLIGKGERYQMLAQSYMMLTCFVPLFGAGKHNKKIFWPLIAAFCGFTLFYNIFVYYLLVDTLLPLVGTVSLMWVMEEREKLCGNRASLFVLSTYLGCIVLIKNSGIYFAAVTLAVFIVTVIKNHCSKINILACVIGPAIALFTWKIHCKLAFQNASTTPHAMTIDNYSAVYSSKTQEIISIITHKFISFVTGGMDLYFLLFFFLVLGLITYLTQKTALVEYARLLGFCFILYATYCIGLYYMYLFSMPTEEAIILASDARYRKTLFIVFFYLAILFFIKLLDDNGNRTGVVIAELLTICVISAITYAGIKNPTQIDERLNNIQERLWLEQAIRDFDIPSGSVYVVLIPQDDSWYTCYMARYLLMSENVYALVADNEEQMNGLKVFPYLFLYDQDNEAIQRWVKMNFPEQQGNNVIKTQE